MKKEQSDCNCDEKSETLEPLSDRDVRVTSLRISKHHRILTVCLHSSFLERKEITFPSTALIANDGAFTTAVCLCEVLKPFDFQSLFVGSSRAGLGNGQCQCKRWGNWSCHGVSFNQKCVDQEAFFNRVEDYCDATCGGYIATWQFDPNC